MVFAEKSPSRFPAKACLAIPTAFQILLKKSLYKNQQSDNMSTRWKKQRTTEKWAVSSGGEHCLDTAGVTSSNLVSPTIEIQRIPCGILFLSHTSKQKAHTTKKRTEFLFEKAGVEGGI